MALSFSLCLSSIMITSQRASSKHRTKDEPNIIKIMNNNKARRQNRTAMAKRGLRSLAIAVALPLSLTLANVIFFCNSSTNIYYLAKKPFWFPPLWALHVACLASSFVMSLSAWLVWAEGGFHRNPMALILYMVQLVLALAWDPIVLWKGASRVGLAVCLAMVGALVGCSRIFRNMNPIAGDLVMPCLAWSAFLCFVNLKLIYFF